MQVCKAGTPALLAEANVVLHCMSMKMGLPLQTMWDAATTSHHADTITLHLNTSEITRENARKMNGKLICCILAK